MQATIPGFHTQTGVNNATLAVVFCPWLLLDIFAFRVRWAGVAGATQAFGVADMQLFSVAVNAGRGAAVAVNGGWCCARVLARPSP